MKRTAQITPEFRELTKKLVHDKVTDSSDNGKKKYITLFRAQVPGRDDTTYDYVQRVGKNSVAFLLIDTSRKERPLQVLSQYSTPHDRFIHGAFTGSIDKDLPLKGIVVEEVQEEAGYDVGEERIHYISSEPVCGNSNEIVHLFIVDITGLKQELKQPENIFEANTQRTFLSPEEIRNSCEWKAQLISLRTRE